MKSESFLAAIMQFVVEKSIAQRLCVSFYKARIYLAV